MPAKVKQQEPVEGCYIKKSQKAKRDNDNDDDNDDDDYNYYYYFINPVKHSISK